MKRLSIQIEKNQNGLTAEIIQNTVGDVNLSIVENTVSLTSENLFLNTVKVCYTNIDTELMIDRLPLECTKANQSIIEFVISSDISKGSLLEITVNQ